ncbi:MAG TPA: oligoendopeptidase F [Phototrophicaceae bacterium]|nr:oligoendopeptidase F [Phototrophicaceae bacterium]
MMVITQSAVPSRSQVAQEYTWNAESVYESREDWAAELKAVSEALPTLDPFQGKLDNAATLADWLEISEALARRVTTLLFYAQMSQAVETSNQTAIGLVGQAGALSSRFRAAVSFAQPEILSRGEATVLGWIKSEPRLAIYAQAFGDLFRQQQHVRSGEVEEILAMAGEPFGQVDNNAEMLTSADLKFGSVTTSSGEQIELSQGNIDTLLESTDREARRTAWEAYQDGYLAMKNTLASNYIASVKRDVFYMRARRYPSSLDAALFADNIPSEVYYNLIETYKKHIPTWHKYWAIRRQALGVETLHPYDIWAPLTDQSPTVSYQQAVDWICEGMKPLGEGYVNALRQGCLQDRWVDIYPNQSKTSGAFSHGTYDTYPFIMMSYDNGLSAMSTLAHELGHSMHSYLTGKNQPFAYSGYSLFVAEVASNFNQAMVRANLFKTNSDPDFQIAMIEEAMNNIHRYFFIMPTLSRFELEIHERVERGEGVTADDMIELMADLFSEGYGGEMHVDRERVGITWAQFPHLYSNFYVFQYATGISAAHALAGGILAGTPGAADQYLKFLSAGSSVYPVDALQLAGVDMRTPEAVERTFAVLAGYVDRLAQLTD